MRNERWILDEYARMAYDRWSGRWVTFHEVMMEEQASRLWPVCLLVGSILFFVSIWKQ